MRLAVEIASTQRQQDVGLSGRASLDRDSGMLFVFDAERPGDEGFWMYGTRFPLDIAFIGEDGDIRRILSMEVCAEPATEEECPPYFPGVPYVAALEVDRGWYDRNGVGVGARVGRPR